MKVLTKEDLDPLEQLALVNLSYSRFNTYEMCNAKYFYSYILKEPRVFGAAASLGNILHAVLEDHVGEELDFDEMLASMDKHRREYDPDKEIDAELLNAGEQMLAEFVDRHYGEEFEIIGKELPFEIVVGSALVRGFIDLVLRAPDGSIHIVDYKSGKYEVATKNIADDLQLGVYALAVRSLFPDEDSDIYAELYYLRSGHRKGHQFTIGDLEDVYDRVLEEVNTILKDRHFKVTEKKFVCSFCDFRKSGICKTGVMRYGKN